MSERKSTYGQQPEVDPRIFSRVYSHISRHRGSADTGILLDLISAISLDRGASYFEILERLEPRTRDLGLELLKTKLHGDFPPEAWKDAYQFAKELNQRNDETIKQDSAARPRGQDSLPALRIRQEAKREARHSDGSLRFVSKSTSTRAPDPILATAARSDDFETRIGRESNGYLWGGVAAATVIGLFVLVVALDERTFDRRLETFTSWLSEPIESPPQAQEPAIAEVDTTRMPEQTPAPVIAGVDTLPAPTPEQTLEGAPDVLTRQSEPTAEKPQPIADEPTAVEDDKIAITPPLASASESDVPDDPSLSRDVSLAPPDHEPAVEHDAPPVITSEPPKPIKRAVPEKAKSDSKVRSKPVKPSRANRPVPSPSPPTVETVEPITPQPQLKTPEAAAIAEPALENSTPPAAVESVNEAVSVEQPRSDAVALPAQVEPARGASQTQKVIANPTFVERLMGFKPGERIARIQPGRQANQPQFIRQLEGVDGPPEDRSGAEAAAK